MKFDLVLTPSVILQLNLIRGKSIWASSPQVGMGMREVVS